MLRKVEEDHQCNQCKQTVDVVKVPASHVVFRWRPFASNDRWNPAVTSAVTSILSRPRKKPRPSAFVKRPQVWVLQGLMISQNLEEV